MNWNSILLTICVGLEAFCLFALKKEYLQRNEAIENYYKTNHERKCPVCNSTDLSYNVTINNAGTSAYTTKAGFMPGLATFSSNDLVRHNIAICKSCGNNWYYLTKDDEFVQSKRILRKRRFKFTILILIVFFLLK